MIKTTTQSDALFKIEKRAMGFSLFLSAVFLGIKWWAYYLTNSSAVLSDALESIMHIIAVSFATLCLGWSILPPDEDHLYGHDKIAYFSTGLEGALVFVAGLGAFSAAYSSIKSGLDLKALDAGLILTLVAGFLNGGLGFYLKKTAKKTDSLIIYSNGVHLLSDFWTSCGVALALLLVRLTNIKILDPLFAISVGLFVCYSGLHLIRSAVRGLSDAANLGLLEKVRASLQKFSTDYNLEFERLRLRQSPRKIHVDYHLHFKVDLLLSKAHEIASESERAVAQTLGQDCDVMCHLEPHDLQDKEQGTFRR